MRWKRFLLAAVIGALTGGAWFVTSSFASEPLATTTVLTSNISTARFGQSFILTATVKATPPGTGAPTGQVTYREGATVLGTAPIGTGNKARLTLSLPVGVHEITAEYTGDAMFASSVGTFSQLVDRASTTVTLTGVDPTLGYGEPATFIASVGVVAPGKGQRAGTVTFYDGATPLATVGLNSNKAKLVNPVLPQGAHAISAAYNGSASFEPSSSPAYPLTIIAEPTLTTLSSTPNPSVVGGAVEFTAAVQPAGSSLATPTGMVSFREGGEVLATLPLDANGRAIWTTSSLAAGLHTVSAFYEGDAGSGTSSDEMVHQVREVPSVTLSTTPSQSVSGESVLLRAEVSSPGDIVPTGSVLLKDGDDVLGSLPVDSLGRVEMTLTPAVGEHQYTAVYGGDDRFTPASQTASHQVGRAVVGVAVTASDPSPVTGQSFDLTAVVTASLPGVGAPTGEVTFRNGPAILGGGSLVGGQLTVSVPGELAGPLDIDVEYSGDSGFEPGGGSLLMTIAQAATTVEIDAVPDSVLVSSPVLLSASVAVVAPGAGQPSGTVSFSVGDTGPVLSAPVDANGNAEVTVDTTAAGAYAIVATYDGEAAFAPSSSAAVVVEVERIPVSVEILSSSNPVVYGEPLSLTITVSADVALGPPTGTVDLVVNGGLLASVPLDSTGGLSLSGQAPVPGTYELVVNFPGDAFFLPTSQAFVQSATPAPTTTALVADNSPATFGFEAAFTATVSTPPGMTAAPTGAVVFAHDGAVLGSVPVDDNGTASIATDGLPTGLSQIEATFTGDALYAPSAAVADQQVDIAQVACGLPGGRCNIMFIETDDQSIDTLLDPETGEPRSSYMPYLTNLVKTEPGWYNFTQARAQDPLCGPSRWTLFTGLTSLHHNMTCNNIRDACETRGERSYYSDRDRTFLQASALAGYANSYVGKFENWYPCYGFETDLGIHRVPAGVLDWHVAYRNDMLFDGNFSLVESPTGQNATKVDYAWNFGDGDYGTYVIRDRTLDWFDRCVTMQPCLSMWMPTAPHYPGTPPQDFDASQVTPVPNHYPSFNEGCAGAVDPDISDKPSFSQAYIKCPSGLQWTRNTYQNSLQATDRSVEDLFERLRQLGMYENTIIVFTSDQGFSMNENNHITKEVPYDTATRIPLFIRVPGLAGGRIDDLVYMPDLTSTLYEITGATPLIAPDGLSLLPLMTGAATTLHPDGVFMSHTVLQNDAALNDTHPWWAWVQDCTVSYPCYKTVKYDTGEWEIYDLTDDPYEMRNKVANPVTGYPGDPGWDDSNPLVQALKAKLEEHIAAGV